jgi:hypothetical protein
VSSSSSIFPTCVMYSARERERRRILAQGCEQLSHGLGIFEQEVDRCRRLFYDLQASWEKEEQRKKKRKTKESHCCYHSKACTQVVSTACSFEIHGSHYFHTMLLEKVVSNKRILKA